MSTKATAHTSLCEGQVYVATPKGYRMAKREKGIRAYKYVAENLIPVTCIRGHWLTESSLARLVCLR